MSGAGTKEVKRLPEDKVGRPVLASAEAMSLQEMVLGLNNARMVYSDGRYNIEPSEQSLAGTVAPRNGSPSQSFSLTQQP